MKRIRGPVGLILLASGVSAALWWAWPRGIPPEKTNADSRYDGVRSHAAGLEFSQEDPVTGSVLVLKAQRAVTRDGKVGKLFRTPLRSKVELSRVEMALRNRSGETLIEALAKRGEYSPKKGILTLDDPSRLQTGDREVRTGRLVIRLDGTAEMPGSYEVYRDGRLAGQGRGFSGLIRDIGKDL